MASKDIGEIDTVPKSKSQSSTTRAVVDDGAELDSLGGCGTFLAAMSFIMVIMFFPFSLISSVKVSLCAVGRVRCKPGWCRLWRSMKEQWFSGWENLRLVKPKVQDCSLSCRALTLSMWWIWGLLPSISHLKRSAKSLKRWSSWVELDPLGRNRVMPHTYCLCTVIKAGNHEFGVVRVTEWSK